MAVSYGAKIIEKHFTINKGYSTFRDHKLSADPKMSKLVKSVRRSSAMVGLYTKTISKNEQKFKFNEEIDICKSSNWQG